MTAGYSPDLARPLTPRMRQVIASAAAGATVGQTALDLGISPETVRTIRAACCQRLGTPNFLCAVVTARQAGLA